VGDLTTNISRSEGACNCGCGFNTMDYETIIVVQDACDYFSAKLSNKCHLDINSWCRCLAWNDHEGGSDFSQHIYATACDHSIRDISIYELSEYYLKKYPGKFGIGIYHNFVHLDTRTEGCARWRA